MKRAAILRPRSSRRASAFISAVLRNAVRKYYDGPVKAIIGPAIILAYPALADDENERAAILGIVATLNSQADSLSDLLASDNIDIDPVLGTKEPPEPYGSVILRRSQPMLLLFKKYGTQWRIACILAEKSK